MALTTDKIVKASGANTVGDGPDLLTTVGTPGADDDIVSEQGIREALTALQTSLYEYKNFIIDGSGSAITTGIKGDMVVCAGTIVGVWLLADQTGSIKVDLWKDTYANFPPTDADTIMGGNEPEISSATKDVDTTLTGWTTSLTATDIIRVNVDSCATITRCTLTLKIQRS